MKKLVVSMALLMMLGAPGAFAQSGTQGAGMSKGGGSAPQAPVGHRQPRASDVPDEKNLSNPNDAMSKEDALLDKKIKSICRGC
jgi:hypothetical protein